MKNRKDSKGTQDSIARTSGSVQDRIAKACDDRQAKVAKAQAIGRKQK